MYSHAPPGYRCPFCDLAQGGSDELTSELDIVARRDTAFAFISPRWWPNNQGHVLVVPTAHYENLYDLEPAHGHGVHDLTRDIAIAMRATYGCTGTSVRQHNEPDGNQDVWHYHVHVFPRYPNDNLYASRALPGFADHSQRQPYAARLRSQLT
jgi:histidine triad (HIT) family protein